MGKAVGQPCHTLFGPQCRGYVPVSSWFNATSPARMAEAVQYYAAMGHTYVSQHRGTLCLSVSQQLSASVLDVVGG